jgi:hypothetical protein
VGSSGDDGGDDDTDTTEDDQGTTHDTHDTQPPDDTEAPDETEPPDTTEATDTTEGSDGEISASVEAYCDAVAEYVEQVQAALADPSGDVSALVETANELATQAGQLQPATGADAQRIQECSAEATSAITGG